MTGAQDPQQRTDGELTQHSADEAREDWDVAATNPQPTGAGAGETPDAAAAGSGGRDGNLGESGRLHGEQDPDRAD
ncbi:hypothetical protein [Ornithinimicrobium cryptoxanthini]|uniref:Uncharacterized protein n=1 Tax=Ornithinimicrobium cryptoxanthini TaxID=2934161 RepID=A0ABY4YEH6_9MICO|nr:hypothetical protein [Ornithinimicrobium cryptoxanthini]USQ75166.1 hypothetical protein NF557_11035 [Ornithinimicrobium cryptoxanthini]